MTNYYIEKDNKIILFDTNKQKLVDTLRFMTEYQNFEIKETERPIKDFQFADSEEFIQEQAQKERERIGKLTMTKRVFALMLEEYGISYSMLKQVIASNERAQLEWDLCIELERSNPLLDLLAGQEPFNLTPDDLDNMFKYANGELAKKEGVNNFKNIDVENPNAEAEKEEESVNNADS